MSYRVELILGNIKHISKFFLSFCIPKLPNQNHSSWKEVKTPGRYDFYENMYDPGGHQKFSNKMFKSIQSIWIKITCNFSYLSKLYIVAYSD